MKNINAALIAAALLITLPVQAQDSDPDPSDPEGTVGWLLEALEKLACVGYFEVDVSQVDALDHVPVAPFRMVDPLTQKFGVGFAIANSGLPQEGGLWLYDRFVVIGGFSHTDLCDDYDMRNDEALAKAFSFWGMDAAWWAVEDYVE